MIASGLATLLSQTLVAYTIEFDNEFEHRLPHRTTTGGPSAGGGPWLVSMVMWFNCMRHVGDAPIPVHELERRARTPTNLDGMRRWRYVDVEAESHDARSKPPRADLLVRSTATGRLAQDVWRPLAIAVEARWRQRWGTEEIDAVRHALVALVSRFTLDLPDCLPILGYGLWSAGPSRPAFAPCGAGSGDEGTLPLPTLLARALLMLAIDFEARSKVSLAIHADVLRILEEHPVPIRELPRRSGVSKEAISMALGVLAKRELVVIAPNPSGSPGRTVRLTPNGSRSRGAHERLLGGVEADWESRFGADAVSAVRSPLERLTRDALGSGLFAALRPYPGGWRASVPRLETLPHFPMVLHRGDTPTAVESGRVGDPLLG